MPEDEIVDFGKMTVEERLAWLDKPSPKAELITFTPQFTALPHKRTTRVPTAAESSFPWSHDADGYSYLELPDHTAFATLHSMTNTRAELSFFDWDNHEKYPQDPEVFQGQDSARYAMRKAEEWYTAEVSAYNAKIEAQRRHRQNRI